MAGYYDRALKSRDPRFARVLEKLGYGRRDMTAVEPEKDEMSALRDEYLSVVGKRPFNGWDADTLREKIVAAQLDGEE